jgi:hypothetical protein
MPEPFAAFRISDIEWRVEVPLEEGLPIPQGSGPGIANAFVTCGKCNLMWRSRDGPRVGELEPVAGGGFKVQCPCCQASGYVPLADVERASDH